ncbi:hypothetical protein OPT61_g7990 [Boeremia exigua]|uniref:Uncharacterized protein n=1 Tax=Boeremia exigua TaxID=749465 RepID=A0ACC2I000_9PLEO|nr:hypothetical protein OPT61_g7990 [Boeremia exigua]
MRACSDLEAVASHVSFLSHLLGRLNFFFFDHFTHLLDTTLDLNPANPIPGIPALRSICRDPTVRQLSLPLVNRFYGPSGYPALFAFPGCTVSNERQAEQAPGLLNCTALGREVQACQRSGRRVLLSVKADSAIAVGGGIDFGDPYGESPRWGGYSLNDSIPFGVYFPNLFDDNHVPSALAQTLFSLFGEGKTERADLRPLGPDTPTEDGISWLTRPLGEEVVVDGFDVQVPRDWEGTYQENRFGDFVTRMRQLNDEAWKISGGIPGGLGDLGANGKGVIYKQYIQKRRVQRVVMVGGFEVLVE